ncbi:hypothetical protein CEXT_245771, partial [Caerostris extrusa]
MSVMYEIVYELSVMYLFLYENVSYAQSICLMGNILDVFDSPLLECGPVALKVFPKENNDHLSIILEL